jgi:hypothetical protein
MYLFAWTDDRFTISPMVTDNLVQLREHRPSIFFFGDCRARCDFHISDKDSFSWRDGRRSMLSATSATPYRPTNRGSNCNV